MTTSFGLVDAFDRVFEQHVARIKRIVAEELSGCSPVFDQCAWPIIRFRVQDAHGVTVSKVQSNFSMAELERLADRKLRSMIRNRCQLSETSQERGKSGPRGNSIGLSSPKPAGELPATTKRNDSREGRKAVGAPPMQSVEVQQNGEIHSRAAFAGDLFQTVKAEMRGRSGRDFPMVLESVFQREFSKDDLDQLKYNPSGAPEELIRQLWYVLVFEAYFAGHPQANLRLCLLPPSETPNCYLWNEAA
jgi:hypothetical protein